MHPDTLAPGVLVFYIDTTTLLTGMITTTTLLTGMITTIENGKVSVLFENGTEDMFHLAIADNELTVSATDIKLGDLVYGLDINNEIITGVVVQLHSKTLLVLWADLAETSYQLSPSVKFPTYKGACSVKEGSGW